MQITTVEEKLQYRVLVLGPLALEREGARIDVARWQGRVQALFKLLVTGPNRQMRREELVDILWPEAEPEAGAGNLRILVHRLRLALGGDPSPVLASGGWVSLNPAYRWDLDLELMEELVRDAGGDIARLEAAAALYRGEPLIEDRYADWSAPLRDRAQRAWRQACLKLASLHRARGQYAAAAAWYARYLETDPLDEEVVCGLMRMLGEAGNPVEALRQFQRFAARLLEEVDAPPAPETLALAEALREQPPANTAQPAPPLPVGSFLGAAPEGALIGRSDELERALLAADAVAAGAGRTVLLSGEVGVGKTRVAQEVMLQLRDRRFLVAVARCYERDRAVPFAPFLDLLAQAYALAPGLVREEAERRWPSLAWLLPEGMLSPDEPAVEEPEEEHALFQTCAGLLDLVGRERPIALLLDDLQWADEGTLELLRYLTHQTRGSRVLLLGAYRDGDISREHPVGVMVRELVREHLVERIPLVRLGPDEARTLLLSLLGDEAAPADARYGAETSPSGVPADFIEFVYRRTKGNPFYIHRMVQGLGGRYRLVRQIGAGGMGRIFEAVDIASGERVAVKLMFARTEADPKALLRFRQEGATLARLQHPNIVQVLDTVLEEHASCIAMELVEGTSLQEMIRGRLPPLPQTKHLATQVAAALVCAHELGIVHRDIKPGNLLVTAGGEVKVADFGIARLLRPHPDGTTMTSTGMTLGTPLYMAPEQIQSGRVDGRADVYSLGAVLYHLVTGRPPFSGEDPLAVAYQHVHEAPLPPRALRGDLPEDWEALILKALAKQPADRFQTAVAMQRAITALSEPAEAASPVAEPGPEPAAAPAGMVSGAYAGPELPAPRRRRPARWGAALAVTIMAAAGLVLFAAHSFLGTSSDLLSHPAGLALDAAGNIYAVDQGNGRLLRFSPSGRLLGRSAFHVALPIDVAVGNGGDLFVSDAGHERIDHFRGGRLVGTLPFNTGALATDAQGNLYASDYGHRQIWVIAQSSGRLIRTLHIQGINVGSEPFPSGLTVNGGDLWVADRDHNQIVELAPDGSELHRFGGPGTGAGQFEMPSDVAIGPDGNAYVADTRNDRIQEFSLIPQWHYLYQWGSPGNGPGQFDRPVSIVVDGRSNIYVSDYFGNRLQKLDPSGPPIWQTDGVHLKQD